MIIMIIIVIIMDIHNDTNTADAAAERTELQKARLQLRRKPRGMIR